jgi:HK97 family phage major capsid protein
MEVLTMDKKLIEEKISALNEVRNELFAKLGRENRKANSTESSLLNEIDQEIRKLQSTPQESLTRLKNSNISRTPSGPFKSFGQQLQAVAQAARPGQRADERLFQIRNAATGLNEGIGSEGGFLVQTDFSNEILQDSFNEGLLAKRCRRQPISANSNSIKIPGVDETSRATGSRFGGVQGYWLDEAAEKQKSKPKFRQIELNLKKNVVLIYSSDELLADATALEAYIREVAPKEIAFQIDDGIINGVGAGQMLGILNSGCLVTQNKESGQDASTLLTENILSMAERTLGPLNNYAWFYNKKCLRQIYSMSLSVGTGGSAVFLAAGSLPSQPENRLLGLPMIEVEQCQALGTAGDLILADLKNGYIIADKGGIQADMSIHVEFLTDQSVFRFVYRVDGQPVRASALEPYKGGAGAAQSHFVALETR